MMKKQASLNNFSLCFTSFDLITSERLFKEKLLKTSSKKDKKYFWKSPSKRWKWIWNYFDWKNVQSRLKFLNCSEKFMRVDGLLVLWKRRKKFQWNPPGALAIKALVKRYLLRYENKLGGCSRKIKIAWKTSDTNAILSSFYFLVLQWK